MAAAAQDAPPPAPDLRALVSTADLVYEKPVPRSEEGMPIGNGRMGTLVWTTPNRLRMQINRPGVYANSSATNSSTGIAYGGYFSTGSSGTGTHYGVYADGEGTGSASVM